MYLVLAGELPFDNNELSQEIRSADVEFRGSVWKTVSAEAKDLITKLIVRDPVKRFTIQQALKHPWIENVINIIVVHCRLLILRWLPN